MCALLSLAHLSSLWPFTSGRQKFSTDTDVVCPCCSGCCRHSRRTVWSGCTTQCETETHEGKWRPSAGLETARERVNHTFVRLYTPHDTPALPLRTRLQFIRQAFPASAEKQTDSSLLPPADLCLSPAPSPSPSSPSVVSESLFSEHIISKLNCLCTLPCHNTFVLFWPFCVSCLLE